jgi:3-oxoacyl-[acyl-carrier protein] reductase
MNSAVCKTAIVTGTLRRIGAAVAQRLASDGFRVVVNYTAGADDAETRVAAILEAGGSAVAIHADVSDAAAMREVFDRAEVEFGGVDVLVNSAGIMQLSTIARCEDGYLHRHVAINLKGVFNSMHEASTRLRNAGRIVTCSSRVVGLSEPNYNAYAATKAGVDAMTHMLADAFRGRNITVNLIAPGPAATDVFASGRPQQLANRVSKLEPRGRLGPHADIVGVVAFLAGPDGAWVNAQVLR